MDFELDTLTMGTASLAGSLLLLAIAWLGWH